MSCLFLISAVCELIFWEIDVYKRQAIYIAVSYKHEKSGLGKGCDGNCGSCGLRSCKTDKK